MVGISARDVVVLDGLRQLVFLEFCDSRQIRILIGLERGDVELGSPPTRANHAYLRLGHLIPPWSRLRPRGGASPRHTHPPEAGLAWLRLCFPRGGGGSASRRSSCGHRGATR